MNPPRKFNPDLQACELEDRLLPVMTNLGVIVLTTPAETSIRSPSWIPVTRVHSTESFLRS